MPPETSAQTHEALTSDLNRCTRYMSAASVLARALDDQTLGRVAMVSSFGAESVVLLHMISELKPSLPILFIDTELLFPETLAYQRDVASQLGLTNVQRIRPDAAALAQHDPYGALKFSDPDKCCNLRKTAPLEAALAGYDSWITGRKRHQSDTRATIDFFEADTDGRIKINPLAHWVSSDANDYITQYDLPRHPLIQKGYGSIGCAPCTSPIKPGEDPRAGRWRGMDKTECGIHFSGGSAQRTKADDKGQRT